MQQAKASKLRVVGMVTTVREAILAEQAGCDAIVAQGGEAGYRTCSIIPPKSFASFTS